MLSTALSLKCRIGAVPVHPVYAAGAAFNLGDWRIGFAMCRWQSCWAVAQLSVSPWVGGEHTLVILLFVLLGPAQVLTRWDVSLRQPEVSSVLREQVCISVQSPERCYFSCFDGSGCKARSIRYSTSAWTLGLRSGSGSDSSYCLMRLRVSLSDL